MITFSVITLASIVIILFTFYFLFFPFSFLLSKRDGTLLIIHLLYYGNRLNVVAL